MKRKMNMTYIVFRSILLAAIYCLLSVTSAFSEENCLSCHSQFKDPAKAVHAALGMGCETCHQSIEGMRHPEQKGGMKLSDDVPGLCYGCHDESKFKGKFIHLPVSSGLCTTCHNSHQSEFSKILIDSLPQLCYKCHESKTSKRNVHSPMAKGQCTVCHRAHASNTTSLLMTRHLNDLCVSCHTKYAKGPHAVRGLTGNHPMWKKPDPSRPGKEMSCASCHDPHSSDFSKLMPQKMLCRKCHKY